MSQGDACSSELYGCVHCTSLRFTKLLWSRFPRSGWIKVVLLLVAGPKQARLPQRSPAGPKDVSCCQTEVTLRDPFYFQTQATCQHPKLPDWRFKHWAKVRLNSRWQVSNLGIFLWTYVAADWATHTPWTVRSWEDSVIARINLWAWCDCTADSVSPALWPWLNLSLVFFRIPGHRQKTRQTADRKRCHLKPASC